MEIEKLFSLSFEATPRGVCRARTALIEREELSFLDPESREDIRLSIGEILTNAAKHGEAGAICEVIAFITEERWLLVKLQSQSHLDHLSGITEAIGKAKLGQMIQAGPDGHMGIPLVVNLASDLWISGNSIYVAFKFDALGNILKLPTICNLSFGSDLVQSI